MVIWFYWFQLFVAGVAAILSLFYAARRRSPNDLTLGSVAVMGVTIVVQIAISIFQPSLGNHPSGSLLEYWMYLLTALVMVVAGLLWALVERSPMSNVVLGLLGGSIAVMLVRMHTIWFVNLA